MEAAKLDGSAQADLIEELSEHAEQRYQIWLTMHVPYAAAHVLFRARLSARDRRNLTIFTVINTIVQSPVLELAFASVKISGTGVQKKQQFIPAITATVDLNDFPRVQVLASCLH